MGYHKLFHSLLVDKLGGKCEICGSQEKLHIHHRDKNRRNYELSNLQLLCNKCHVRVHRAEKAGRIFLGEMEPHIFVYSCVKPREEARWCKRLVPNLVWKVGGEYVWGCKGKRPCSLAPLTKLIKNVKG